MWLWGREPSVDVTMRPDANGKPTKLEGGVRTAVKDLKCVST